MSSKSDIYNRLGFFALYFHTTSLTSYSNITIFTIGKARIVLRYIAGIRRISYVGWENEYWWQLNITPYILSRQFGICNQTDISYLPGFIFLVEKQESAIEHLIAICRASYFGKENKCRWQVYIASHILGQRTGIRN